jgi:putative nucleotidyltransferase with HDIG domain
MQTVQAINAVAARHDHYTAHHQDRVAILTLAVGRELGLPSDSLDGLYLGALVHDLGKVAIPSELLNKPGRLTPEEFALAKTHVQVGCEILQHVNLPWPICKIVAQHHERLDGSGYPHALTAEAIIPEARIVAVADVFQALCEDRPYRKALGIRGGLDELERGSGTKFDADVVRAVVAITNRLNGAGPEFWESMTLDVTGDSRRRGVGRTVRASRMNLNAGGAR